MRAGDRTHGSGWVYARSAGCDVATVTVQPASRSQQNVQREGFHLLYARQLLVQRGQINFERF